MFNTQVVVDNIFVCYKGSSQ